MKFLKIGNWTISIDQIAAFRGVDEEALCAGFVKPAHIVFHLKTGKVISVFSTRPHEQVEEINVLLKDQLN